jgi:hypothetical protein
MKKRHYVLISTFLGSLAALVAALPDWHNATTPAFVGSLLLNGASFIGAIASDRATLRRRDRDRDLGTIRWRGGLDL